MNKLDKYSDQTFRKRVIYTAIRKYSVEQVTEMLGLGIGQESLTYAYSNKSVEEAPVPNNRWKHFAWELSKLKDKTVVRELCDPAVLITLRCIKSLNTNGDTADELRDMIRELSEVEEHLKDNPQDALKDIQDMRDILDRYEAEIKEMQ